MNVQMINYTPFALETLIFTKNTRLTLRPELFEEIKAWPMTRKLSELEYMRHTIQSQFEFVDYIFLITGVTRAFTHQLVRHRVGVSFAQQAQRAVDMTGFEFETGPSIRSNTDRQAVYDSTMQQINAGYQALTQAGANPQDARGVLPTNICTNIVFKANLRTLHDMAKKRLCVKAQGEFQDVFRLIRLRVLEIHPWVDHFIRVWCAAHGTCMFHTFPVSDCPVKPIVYDPHNRQAYGGGKAGSLDFIQLTWERERAEAQPRVSLGKDKPIRSTWPY